MWSKVLKGALIAGLGALLTYVTNALPNVNIPPEWLPIVTAGWSVVVNFLRKLLGIATAALAIAAAVIVTPLDANAQLASEFSHGPTLPFMTVKFDETGDAHAGILDAGAGYSFNFNMLPDATGEVRWLTVGVPMFVRFAGGDPNNLAVSTGITVGTFNNMVAFGAALDLVNVNGEDTGAFLGDVSKHNVMILLAFGFNLGGGSPPLAAAKSTYAVPEPPPNYMKIW